MNEQTKQPTDYERGWREACDSIDGQLTPLSVDDAEYVGDVIDSARARKCSLLPKDLHEPQLLEACREMLEFVSGSSGVSGWHLNGRIIPWGEVVAVESIRAAVADATGEHNQ